MGQSRHRRQNPVLQRVRHDAHHRGYRSNYIRVISCAAMEVDVAEESSLVLFQPCEVFRAGPESDPAAGVCATCGWLEEDHRAADAERPLVAIPV
jgi:hypothetical protein